MANLTDAYETSFAKLLYQAVAIADIAENDSTTPLASIRYSLHESSPGDAGDQTSNEGNYAPYVRVSVARTTTGHTVASGAASPAATVAFAACTSGTDTITHFGNGTATSGAGSLIVYGTVTPNISVAAGVTPQLTTATTITWA